MNPPFSVAAHVEGEVRDAAWRRLASAFARLRYGGRIVAITGAALAPEVSLWRETFVALEHRGRVVFSAAVAGPVYARHGTTVETRLTVIDKVPAEDPTRIPEGHGLAPNTSTLLYWVLHNLPPRRRSSCNLRLPLPPAASR